MTTKSVKRSNKVTKPTRTSNAFASFEQFQLQEFKEAFNLLDKDRDGLIGYSDLESAFSSLGKNGANEIIKEMLEEANGPLNFTMFLTLFADRMANTDNENIILNAFATFDDDQSGKLEADKIKNLLTTSGDRFTQDEAEEFLQTAPFSSNEKLIDYREFAKILKRGGKD